MMKTTYLSPSITIVALAARVANNTYGDNDGLITLGSGQIDAGMGQAPRQDMIDTDEANLFGTKNNIWE